MDHIIVEERQRIRACFDRDQLSSATGELHFYRLGQGQNWEAICRRRFKAFDTNWEVIEHDGSRYGLLKSLNGAAYILVDDAYPDIYGYIRFRAETDSKASDPAVDEKEQATLATLELVRLLRDRPE